MELQHQELVDKANASVAEAAKKAQADPLRPIYHLMTAANWINDPNGPVYFDGAYHVFLQHDPYGDGGGNKAWGHAVSRDLAHWEHWPIALVSNPDSYDKDGVWSGCCVIDDGVPTIMYTGVHPEVQCIARSTDGMRTWRKYEKNPVIGTRPRDDLEGFRDPFVWKEADGWYVVIGSGIKGQGGTVLLYRSQDLQQWDYLGPLCIGFGTMWECPNFFPLGNKHVLVVSPYGDVKYSIGDYKDHKFTPGEWQSIDLGGSDMFYAPNCMLDPRGRRIMWGWIRNGGTAGYPWNGCLTLPRVLSLRKDGRLGIEPAPDIAKLRSKHYDLGEIALTPETPNPLKEIRGDALEIVMEIEPGSANAIVLELRRTADGGEKTEVTFDIANGKLTCGDRGGAFALLADEHVLKLHVFLDRSVIEVYANGRAALTARCLPKDPAPALGVGLSVRGGNAKVRSLHVYEMGSMWRESSPDAKLHFN
jgi:beta-fructofuranosidase